MLHAVIMAGGSGTRFWPLSRTALPKQLLNLTDDRTMIQHTADRCEGLINPERTWVITNRLQATATREQLPQLPAENILEEPCARNTAPCVGLAAVQLLAKDPEATMLLMPADHVIESKAQFQQAVQTAAELVEANLETLSLFGVIPNFPSTGFGYIERGEASATSTGRAYEVASFREKPDRGTAEQFLKQGKFFWNCGIFVWKARTILEQIRKHEPELHRVLMEIQAVWGTDEQPAVLEKKFPECPSISIDYAVLERAERIQVIEAPFEWDDVGSWQALHRLIGRDEAGNTVVGKHLGVDTTDCIVRSNSSHLVATLGISNCIVVHTPDATLVADKQDENAIKELIARLNEEGFTEVL